MKHISLLRNKIGGVPVLLYRVPEKITAGTSLLTAKLDPLESVAEGLGADRIIVPGQPHMNKVFIEGESFPEEIGYADGVISSFRGTLCAVKTADCFPVLMTDGYSVAALHLGRRSIMGQLIVPALRWFGKKRDRIRVIIGPGIGFSCYRVGLECIKEYREKSYFNNSRVSREGGTTFMDLRGIIFDQLVSLGILPEKIRIFPHCSHCRTKQFYSYRKGETVKRNYTFIFQGRYSRGQWNS